MTIIIQVTCFFGLVFPFASIIHLSEIRSPYLIYQDPSSSSQTVHRQMDISSGYNMFCKAGISLWVLYMCNISS